MSLKIKTAILCEDVRQETGNKQSAMGIFSGDIVLFSEAPADIFVSFYLEFLDVPLGQSDIWIKISGPGEGSAKMKARAEVHSKGVMVLAGPKMTLHCEKGGTLEVAVGEEEDSLDIVITKEVIFSPPIAHQPPS